MSDTSVTHWPFIGGAWHRDTVTAGTLVVYDKASHAQLGTVATVGLAGIRRAIEAAHTAWRPWQALPAARRGAWLEQLAQRVLAQRLDVERLIVGESGKPMTEAVAEVDYAVSFLTWFAEEARRLGGEWHSATKHRIDMVRRGVGVVGIITPWNFPLAMVTRKLAPAWAAGCTVVHKPAELTPLTSLWLAAQCEAIGAPPGTYNVVAGDAAELGHVLMTAPEVAKLSFTGSTRVGRLLAQGSGLKRLSLELGGNAPFLIWADSDPEVVLRAAQAAKFRNAGQTCVAANRFLIEASAYAATLERLTAMTTRLVLGPGHVAETQLGPVISHNAQQRLLALVADAEAHGARIIRRPVVSTDMGPGAFLAPAVVADVSPAMRLWHEEVFGPIVAVAAFPDGDDAGALALANDTQARLVAYAFTEDAARLARLPGALNFGMVGLNLGLLSHAAAPFGGVAEAGYGREGSRVGLDDYTSWQYVASPHPEG